MSPTDEPLMGRYCGFCDDVATGHVTDDHGDRYGYCARHRAEVASLIEEEA